jgi:hypothetical protein
MIDQDAPEFGTPDRKAAFKLFSNELSHPNEKATNRKTMPMMIKSDTKHRKERFINTSPHIDNKSMEMPTPAYVSFGDGSSNDDKEIEPIADLINQKEFLRKSMLSTQPPKKKRLTHCKSTVVEGSGGKEIKILISPDKVSENPFKLAVQHSALSPEYSPPIK